MNYKCSPNFVAIDLGNLLCHYIFALVMYQHMSDGNHYVNVSSSPNYIFATSGLTTHVIIVAKSHKSAREADFIMGKKAYLG